MGTIWNVASLDQIVLDRQDIMSAAITCLLSSPSMFAGECSEFANRIINSYGNGYMALYQIIRLVHPLLGKSTSQPVQPQQKRTQWFSDHIVAYQNYFQTEASSGCHYSTNDRILLIISRLHITWRDVMRSKYTQLVPQNSTITHIPLECHLEMLSVTLTQWCGEERMDTPFARSDKQDTPVFALDGICADMEDLSFDSPPHSDLVIGPYRVPADTVDKAVAHMICYVDRGRVNHLSQVRCLWTPWSQG
jgi:hypothetical protein